MAKTDPLDSCSGSEPEESDNSEKSSSEEAEEEEEEVVETRKGISDYEKQRLARIAENKARMGALGLGRMASSLMGSARRSSQRKGKRKVDEDEEYRPIDETDDDNDELFHDSDEDFVGGRSSSRSRKNKVKNRSSTPKKIPVKKHVSNVDNIEEEDDEELMKAIALSLQDSANDAALKERKGNVHVQEDAGRKKRKKSFSSRQMTEDELVLHFFQFDEAGRGAITIRDLRRVAIANDFTWTDMELADMIHCFDSDGDGKLNLDDFRKIAGRCNMIQGKSLMDTTSA